MYTNIRYKEKVDMAELNISTDDMDIVQNWLKLNKRMAKLVYKEQLKRQKEIEKNIRVKDLRPIWNRTN